MLRKELEALTTPDGTSWITKNPIEETTTWTVLDSIGITTFY